MSEIPRRFAFDNLLETEAVIFSSCFIKYFAGSEPKIFGTK